jgi:hypothetical protein
VSLNAAPFGAGEGKEFNLTFGPPMRYHLTLAVERTQGISGIRYLITRSVTT